MFHFSPFLLSHMFLLELSTFFHCWTLGRILFAHLFCATLTSLSNKSTWWVAQTSTTRRSRLWVTLSCRLHLVMDCRMRRVDDIVTVVVAMQWVWDTAYYELHDFWRVSHALPGDISKSCLVLADVSHLFLLFLSPHTGALFVFPPRHNTDACLFVVASVKPGVVLSAKKKKEKFKFDNFVFIEAWKNLESRGEVFLCVFNWKSVLTVGTLLSLV